MPNLFTQKELGLKLDEDNPDFKEAAISHRRLTRFLCQNRSLGEAFKAGFIFYQDVEKLMEIIKWIQ